MTTRPEDADDDGRPDADFADEADAGGEGRADDGDPPASDGDVDDSPAAT